MTSVVLTSTTTGVFTVRSVKGILINVGVEDAESLNWVRTPSVVSPRASNVDCRPCWDIPALN